MCSTPARATPRIELGVHTGVDAGYLQEPTRPAAACMRVDQVGVRDRARRYVDQPPEASAPPPGSACSTPARAKPCIELGVYAGADVGHL